MNKKSVMLWYVLFCAVINLSSARSEISLTGDTSRPESSAFIAGEPVELMFSVKGLSQNDTSLSLKVKIVDEQELILDEKSIAVQANEKGEWTGNIHGPNGKLGFYRVYAALSNGITIPKLVSRPAGYITYCIAPDPATRNLFPAEETFFGIYGGLGNGLTLTNSYLGSRWGIGLWQWGWGNMDSDGPGQFTEKHNATREKIKKEAKKELWKEYCIPSLYIAPTKWKVSPVTTETLGFYTATLTTEGEKYWADYCRVAVKAYAEDNPDRKERFYQITWEPVYPWGFKGADEDLIRIYEIAYPIIHEVDPKAVVVGPTVGSIERPSETELTRRLFEKGLGKYIDGFSIHPYTNMPPEYYHFRENILELKEMIYKYTGRNLPMFSTEQGFATGEKKENELLQARGLVRTNLILMGEGFRMNLAFYIHDYLCEAGYGFFYNLNPKINYGTDKIGPKPIVPAYAAMTYLLEGKKSAGTIDWLGDTALGYAYERGNDIILALWDYGDSSRPVKIPVGVAEVKLYDWMGNSREVKTENGILNVELKQEPIYVAGVSAKLWSSRAVKPIKVDQPRIKAYPGSTIVIRGTLIAQEPIRGTLVMNCDSKLNLDVTKTKDVSLPAGKQEPFEYRFKLPLNILPGTYPMSLNLSQDRTPIAAVGCVVNVEPPVTIGNIEPYVSDEGKIGLRITMKEVQGCESKGSLLVQIKGVPETRKKIDYHLAPHEVRVQQVVYDNLDVSPIRVYPVNVILTAANDYTFTKSADMNFSPIKKMAEKPKIDGDFSEWSAIAPVTLQGMNQTIRSYEYYNGDSDLRANFRFSYDEQSLYVAIEVFDDVFCQNETGFDTWRGDCVQLAIDLDPRKEESRTGNDLADKGSRHRYSEISLALTKKGVEAYRTRAYDEEKFPIELIASKDLCLSVKHNGNRILYEAAIPWRTLGGDKCPESRMIGFALSINDRDTAEQVDPSGIEVFPLKDTKKFGLMVWGEYKK